MLWHEQSWPQIQAIDKNIPVVVPLGSLEQHGEASAAFRGFDAGGFRRARSRETSRRKNSLTANALAGLLGASSGFPGTISMPPSLYSQMIKSVTRCILHAGFRRILFLNGHGGNETPGAQARRK